MRIQVIIFQHKRRSSDEKQFVENAKIINAYRSEVNELLALKCSMMLKVDALRAHS